MTDVRIGIGGWNFPPWRGTFFPEKWPQARELEYASSKFRTLEINATFYGRQAPKSWEKWAATVPDGFQFAIKGSRFCVSRGKLAEGAEGIGNFFAQGMAALGPKLGPILWMFQERRQFDRDDITGFIDLLPETLDGLPLRHVIEPHHESFRDDRFFDLCKSRNIAVVYGDADEVPCIDVPTADFAYARLKRMSEEVPTGYDEAALAGFEQLARGWTAQGRDAYIYMINGAKVRAPAAALALSERLG
ncbi:DUF72 domain-containing protein [Sphingomonas piscis]|uniref:DUF72 domain-containing protein n=1 Tax=Sphingomonas piscis TaxID=2714943 RepID=A0A6G7YRZ0_9SPHN|nr:DUF72 domain-containing protein [Sphingomonas piscis]QIK79507.1 DUF72 domain-containing protein [Sphingomonas piscis]